MVQTDVALRRDVKLEALDDGREIKLTYDGSHLPYFVLKEKDKSYGHTVYVHEIESFNELWKAIEELGENNIERRAKADGLETRRMKAKREKSESAMRRHIRASEKAEQYSGVLMKAMFSRMTASSASRVNWLEFIEDLLISARRDWYNGKYTGGEWIHHYLGSYEEDFRWDEE